MSETRHTRHCPFHNCKMLLPEGIFACAPHWKAMSNEDREAVYAAYRAYKTGKLNLEELRERQAEIMDRVQGPVAPVTDAEKLAQSTAVFLDKLGEFLRCKDQNIEEKDRLLRQVAKMRRDLKDQCDDILHPPQAQPSLFDNPPIEKSPESRR